MALPESKATMSCYDSMVHWSRGSTKTGNRVILAWKITTF